MDEAPYGKSAVDPGGAAESAVSGAGVTAMECTGYRTVETIARLWQVIESVEELVRLCADTESARYRRDATEEASVEVWLDSIARFPDERAWVAQNKAVPLEILATLINDPDPRMRYMAAMKRRIPADFLEILSLDPDEMVRSRVAQHRNISDATPRTMVNDSSAVVARPRRRG